MVNEVAAGHHVTMALSLALTPKNRHMSLQNHMLYLTLFIKLICLYYIQLHGMRIGTYVSRSYVGFEVS